MQEIYRRTPMQKCETTLSHGCSLVNLLNIIITFLLQEHLRGTTSGNNNLVFSLLTLNAKFPTEF